MTLKFPLATSSWDEDEQNAMQRVIASGMFTMGREVEAFERAAAAHFGSKHCIMVNSGSSANLLMVAALFYTRNPTFRLKRGDEVIVPAVSWSTTYHPLHQYGLKVKFVDIDLQTLNYDLEQLGQAVSGRTRAIMAVNLLGNPNDFDEINRIIDGRDILLLEDNCESMGARYQGKMTGTFGLMGTFSTFFSHHICTMEGGLIVTEDDELYQLLISLRAHGWTRNLPKQNLVCSDKSDDPFIESYRFILPGYNVRPLEIEGALGIEQLKKLPNLIAERRKNGKRIQEILGTHPDLVLQKEIGESSWFGFSLVVRPGSSLDRISLLRRLAGLGFECRPIVAGNFAKNEVVKYFDSEIHGSLKNAEYIDANGLFIGNQHFSMTEAMAELARI